MESYAKVPVYQWASAETNNYLKVPGNQPESTGERNGKYRKNIGKVPENYSENTR